MSYLAIPKSHAAVLVDAIGAELKSLSLGEFALARGFARVGGLLAQLKASEGWRELGLTSFHQYISTLHTTYGRSVQQLYSYVLTAEALLPRVGITGLDRIGITKAAEVVRAAKRAKRPITEELLAAAQDEKTGVKEIRALAHRTYELDTADPPKGRYIDLGGFYADLEQYKIFKEAVELTGKLLNIPESTPEWARRQKIILAWAAEFMGTHSAEVYGPQAGDGAYDAIEKEESDG